MGRDQREVLFLVQAFQVAVSEQVDAGRSLVDFGKSESTKTGNQLSGAKVVEKCRV